ncbi:MAG: hypothetical protein ACI4GW_05745 [Lachnospiraceae bacterium]
MEKYNEDVLQYANTYTVSKTTIIHAEHIRIAIMAGILLFVFLCWFFFVLPVYELTPYMVMISTIIVIEILNIPVELIRLYRKAKKCPSKISLNSRGMMFDETYIATTDIKKVTLTHKNAVIKSIYPKNRFIKIKTNGKKYVIWLGTESGFSYQEYAEIADSITNFCITHLIPKAYEK